METLPETEAPTEREVNAVKRLQKFLDGGFRVTVYLRPRVADRGKTRTFFRSAVDFTSRRRDDRRGVSSSHRGWSTRYPAAEHGLNRRKHGYTAAMLVEESRMLQAARLAFYYFLGIFPLATSTSNLSSNSGTRVFT
jgi:hypothetical protein